MVSDDPTRILWRRLQLVRGELEQDLVDAIDAIAQAEAAYRSLLDLMDSTDMTKPNPDWAALRSMLNTADRVRAERDLRRSHITDRLDAVNASLSEAGVEYNEVFAHAQVAEATGTGGNN